MRAPRRFSLCLLQDKSPSRQRSRSRSHSPQRPDGEAAAARLAGEAAARLQGAAAEGRLAEGAAARLAKEAAAAAGGGGGKPEGEEQRRRQDGERKQKAPGLFAAALSAAVPAVREKRGGVEAVGDGHRGSKRSRK